MPKPKTPPGLPLRIAAAERLRRVLAGDRFQPLGATEIADSRDRALANKLVTAALRRQGQLDAMIAELLDRGIPRKSASFEAVLRIALTQLVFMPETGAHSAVFLGVETLKRDPKAQHLRGLLNAVLRRAQTNAARYWTLPELLLLPQVLRDSWAAQYGTAALEGFAAALLETPPLDLTLRDDDPELVAALGAEPVLGDSVRLRTRDRQIEDLPGFKEGQWWVQDAAAALPARFVDAPPGGDVLDLCAAPGGKTLQLAKAGYAVTAVDADAERLGRVRDNLGRVGLTATVVAADARMYRPEAPVDAVLLDAPCSATGTFRRHPEVLWGKSVAAPHSRVELQRQLLTGAAECLKPGGTLVYCVCSLERSEGEEQAAWVGGNLPQLLPHPIPAAGLGGLDALTPEGHVRTHPGLLAPGPAGGTLDGFFIARFRRAPG